MQKEKGFTLIELLAVIVILAVILAIAIPTIANITNISKKSAFESNAKMLLQQIEYKKLEDENFNISNFTLDALPNYNLDNSNYETLNVVLADGKPYITIVGKNKWDGLVACGTLTNINVVSSNDTETCETIPPGEDEIYVGYDSSKGVNKPALASGMTPIKWNGTTWVETTADDTDWYNYGNKLWANAKTADGSMWVWIPRYAYRISSGYHTTTAGTINVKFLKGTTNNSIDGTSIFQTPAYNVGSQTNYILHPAFTFGGTELTGIWVSKFEASAPTTSSCYTAPSEANCSLLTLTPTIVPNVASWRYISIGNAFTVSRNMETSEIYGWGTTGNGIDTHLIKNSEWGAITYLSKSEYGKETQEVWINNSSTYITGCAGNSASQEQATGCTNAYNTTNGVQASTTGNIYGIYDMSGGSWDRVSAYINNNDSSLSANGSSIVNADAKYKDVYSKATTDDSLNNFNLTSNRIGDAIYETSVIDASSSKAWFDDYPRMPNTSNPWFIRGGGYSNTDLGGIFYYNYVNGAATSSHTFRPILLVGTGL